MIEKMKTSSIKKKVEETKSLLVPMFKITEEELKKFQNAPMIREVSENDYPGRNPEAPGYDCLRNMFYFPKSFDIEKQYIEHDSMIYFTSMYLHHQINPELRRCAMELQLGREIKGYSRFRTLVSIYPDIILGKVGLMDRTTSCYRKELQVFIDHGEGFLPELARMSLDDAIKKKIVESE